ncbi:MAG: type VI secretion system protein TssA [Pseudomonadota bacterium]|nr:type VI secretion system protein TssA [Pseudomonadota bacterium]
MGDSVVVRQEDQISQLLELGSIPVSAHSPAGENVKYDSEFEQISTEIAKLESLQGGSVDWALVADLSQTILREKSKDLLVACYLAQGLFKEQGYAGLVDGLGLITTLMENFWPSLWPPVQRMRARAAALSWLDKVATAEVERRDGSGGQPQAVDDALQALSTIEDFLAAQTEPLEFPLGTLRRALGLVKKEAVAGDNARAARPVSDPTDADVAPTTSPGRRSVTPAVSGVVSDLPSQVDTHSPRALRKALLQMSDALRAEDPSDSIAYRLLQNAIWREVCDYPPHDSNGVTTMRPVALDRRQQYQQLLTAQGHRDLIDPITSSLGGCPFWLDGHRMLAEALRGLGYHAAAKAVAEGVDELLSRLPKLSELKFHDGSPFVEEATRNLLNTAQLSTARSSQAGPAATGAPGTLADAALEPAIAKAREVLAAGGMAEAINALQAERPAMTSERQKYAWDLAEARLCLDAGRADVAVLMLESLEERITTHGLERWEPETVIDTCWSLLDAYKRLGRGWMTENVDRTGRFDALCRRLCRLDPQAAVVLAEMKLN